MWILLAVIVSAGQTTRRAILRTSTAVLSAIVAFHLGQRLIYRIKYPGDAYAFDLTSLALWCLLALAAGVVIGPRFAAIGRADWAASGAAAGAVGLLVADAYSRGHNRPDEAPTLQVFAVLAIVLVFVLAAVTRRQTIRTALLSLPSCILAYLLISSPMLDLVVGITR